MARTNQCKACKNECKSGELHLCWVCWGHLSYTFPLNKAGTNCVLCQTPTPAYRVCKPCFEAQTQARWALDTSGPPIPFSSTPAPTPPLPSRYYGPHTNTGFQQYMINGTRVDKATYDLWVAGAIAWDALDPLPTPPSPRVRPPSCTSCGLDLCADLDAYYGHDPRGKNTCAPCRKRHLID